MYVTTAATLADVLLALGIPQTKHADYAQVTVQTVTPDTAAQALESGRKAGLTNVYRPDVLINGNKAVVAYVSSVVVSRSLRAKIRAADKNYDESFTGGDPTALEGAFLALPTPRESGWIKGTEIGREPRGEGQIKAMNGWNALGAAAYAKHSGRSAGLNLNQNWEWLHVRAASCGGKTGPTNLTAGPFGANSLMIPFESLVKTWAESDPQKVEFNFIPLDPGPAFAPKIAIRLRAQGHSMLGNLPESVLVTIDVLGTTVIDKLAGEIIARGVDLRVGVRE